MTDEERAAWESVRDQITTATGYLDEQQASTVLELFEPWRKSDWRDYELNVMRRHAGRLWKFLQPRLNDESQNVEPGTGGAESIWTEIAYHDGCTRYRIRSFRAGNSSWTSWAGHGGFVAEEAQVILIKRVFFHRQPSS